MEKDETKKDDDTIQKVQVVDSNQQAMAEANKPAILAAGNQETIKENKAKEAEELLAANAKETGRNPGPSDYTSPMQKAAEQAAKKQK